MTPEAPATGASLSRSEIERCLNDLVSFEEGFRFQSLAVILAKKRWPELIAGHRKWDHGLDAYDGSGLGLATSITATLDKIKDDAKRARASFPQLKTLIFYTPARITNHIALQWAEEIRSEFGIELIVVSLEDLITSLMDPTNAPLLHSHFGVSMPITEAVRDTLSPTKDACSETIDNWFRQYRLADCPLVDLDLVRIVDDQQQHRMLDRPSLEAELRRGRRVVLEGPPGSGKTTTLLQLGRAISSGEQLCFVVDLPAWIEADRDILEFQAQSEPFRSRSVSAEDLAGLLAIQPVVFLLNGWNEVGEAHFSAAAHKLRALDREYPGAGILLATRTHTLAPPLAGAWHVAVQHLRDKQRRAYLTQLLGERAPALIAQLSDSSTLDSLTRTPLILAEVARLFEAGRPIPETKLEVMRAMTQRIERSEEHRAALAEPPICALAARYLGAMAVEMTERGLIDLTEEAARRSIAHEATTLTAAGQLAAPPEPQSVLTVLCAHHVLQRVDYPITTFRFQHQQFQEFYAALHVLESLKSLTGSENEDAARTFQRTYLNRPAWDEALTMAAEAIGIGLPAVGPPDEAARIGECLVRQAIPVDPILAAGLARGCGQDVWNRVGTELGELLRRWYALVDPHHRRCALAGMLASGSEDFADILVPLLTNYDQQVRLSAYRAGETFHFSSLGSDWRAVVAAWGDGQRADFVREVLDRSKRATLAEEFARDDPSPQVRFAAISALRWIGAYDALGRVLDMLDGPDLLAATSHGIETALLSVPARDRLLDALRTQTAEAEDAAKRIALLHRSIELGDPEAAEGLRAVLDALSEAEIRSFNDSTLLGVMKNLSRIDQAWAQTWIAERLATGVLWPDRWLEYLSVVPQGLADRLLERVGGEELDHKRVRGAAAVFAKLTDDGLARRVWRRLIELHAPLTNDAQGQRDVHRATLRSQLEDLTRALPAALRVSAAINVMASPPLPNEARALIDVCSRAAEEEDLHTDLPNPLRHSLRDALVAVIPFVLGEDDFGGGLKADLAMAIARVAERGDAVHIRRLIDADIRRVREGIEARRRREQGPRANGASMRRSNWYVKALCWLGTEVAEPILLELLGEPEYENDVARGLMEMVMPAPSFRPGRLLLADPGNDPPAVLSETQRARYARAVRDRVTRLLWEIERSENNAPLILRTKNLAGTLARLDGRQSRDLVLQAMALPLEWDGWARSEALVQLLRVHPRLPMDAVLAVLNPTIEYTLRQGVFSDQNADLLKRCLGLLALGDDPERGVARIQEVLSRARLGGYHFRDLASSFARNGSEQALDLLVEIANTAGAGFDSFGQEWIAAVGLMDLSRARDMLVEPIDPRVEPIVPALQMFPEELAKQIARLARTNPAIMTHIREICAMDLMPGQRQILAYVVAELGDEETVLAGLRLIRDDVTPAIPHHLTKAVENIIMEHEPYRGMPSAYSLVPRARSAVRASLFEMVTGDPVRRRSSFSLLGLIEEWRLDHGRPPDEPRHPAINSGFSWPPLELFDPQ